MKKILFKGCGTAIVTPFTENGINFSEFKKLLEFQIKEGVNESSFVAQQVNLLP